MSESYDYSHQPMDAPARRAHFESKKSFNAFHDGAMTPEIMAKITEARNRILKKLKGKVKK